MSYYDEDYIEEIPIQPGYSTIEEDYYSGIEEIPIQPGYSTIEEMSMKSRDREELDKCINRQSIFMESWEDIPDQVVMFRIIDDMYDRYYCASLENIRHFNGFKLFFSNGRSVKVIDNINLKHAVLSQGFRDFFLFPVGTDIDTNEYVYNISFIPDY